METAEWQTGKNGEIIVSPEEQVAILEECDRRLDELAQVLWAVWQRQQPAQRVN
jgi:hypothetical protein